MSLPNFFANGQSLRALGFLVSSVDGWFDALAVTDPTVVLPGRRGAMRTGQPPASPPRAITLTGTVVDTTQTRTHAGLLSMLTTLKALLMMGTTELVGADALTLGILVEPVSCKVAMDGPALAATSATVTIALQALDPVFYELEPQCIGFGATRTALSLGTVPSDCLIRVTGATNPVITYRDGTGTAVHTIGLTRALAVGTDYEELDVGQMLITRSQSGVASDDSGAFSSGDFEDFVLSPVDGDALSGLSPTIEVSGLSAGGWAEVVYRRRFQ